MSKTPSTTPKISATNEACPSLINPYINHAPLRDLPATRIVNRLIRRPTPSDSRSLSDSTKLSGVGWSRWTSSGSQRKMLRFRKQP
ncbi:hypothetical protein L3X38_029741 [Prunus dulcis]|uniref:Uncharacterized protein n=1 Tax=Prunus dulcis TaxID=3755 RepID=A0AAD4VTI7_PRUDU|nr:hypothetical protein L3X38_029741 [Prunus dulcis]